MQTLPTSFSVEVKMSEVQTDPVVIRSESGEFIHQEEDGGQKWKLHCFKLEVDEDTQLADIDMAYAVRNLRPLPEHLFDLFIKLYPNFGKGHRMATQHPTSDCRPEITTTSMRMKCWDMILYRRKDSKWETGGIGFSVHFTSDLKGYRKGEIWFVGVSK